MKFIVMARCTRSSAAVKSPVFLDLKETTTAEELAAPLLHFLAESEKPGNSTIVDRLLWNMLMHYVPIVYLNASGMHGERPAHCDTLLACIGHLLFNGNPEKGLAELQANSRPQQVCGRMFRGGESTYLCL